MKHAIQLELQALELIRTQANAITAARTSVHALLLERARERETQKTQRDTEREVKTAFAYIRFQDKQQSKREAKLSTGDSGSGSSSDP